jgi:hypothetical protein
MMPLAYGQPLLSNPGIRARVEFRLGDPSKKRYSVCRGFAGKANSDASAFRPEPTQTI